MSCSARRIPISSGVKARPIARVCRRACGRSASRTTSCSSTSSSISATLLDFISMCDVYVTPYLNEAQMTSGTLAYSFGLGKAVVSTPYWHARELLADGRGMLVPFGDSRHRRRDRGLLTDDAAAPRHARARLCVQPLDDLGANRGALPRRRSRGRRRGIESRAIARHDRERGSALPITPPPQMQLGHLLSMCDDTGLFQHAVHSVPDRSHGYCVDDNARALLVACALNAPGEQRLPEALTARFAAFVQHAWNPDTRRFRNFMSFDRRWLEDDRLGRQPRAHALGPGRVRAQRCQPSRRRGRRPCSPRRRRRWRAFSSPRAWAFTLLGPGCILQRRRARTAARASCGIVLAGPAVSHAVVGRDRGLGVVRGRACLRQCTLAAGPDRHRCVPRMRPPMSRPA